MACKIIADDEKTSPIQTLDFSKVENFQPGSPSWLSMCSKVRSAVEENGCFVVTCDELSLKLTNDVFSQSTDLFALPTETKVKNKSDEPYRGYIGQDPRIPLYESLAIDNVTELGVAQKFMNLMWPEGKENFCKSVHSYATLLASINQTIVQMLFQSYGAGKHYPKMAAINGHLLRFLRYRDPSDTESDTRLAAHTDLNFATFVHQHNLGGLEIETSDGSWVGLEVANSQILFMAGDTMKAWSNDRIKACRHRVKLSAGNGARYSLGLFTWNNGVIEVPEELVDEEHPLGYKPFDPRDFVRFYCTNPEAKKHSNPLKAYCGVIES